VDAYLKELHEDRQLLELLDVKVEDAAVGMLLLEALCINALWDFGIVFEQVRAQLRICCMRLVTGTSGKDAAGVLVPFYWNYWNTRSCVASPGHVQCTSSLSEMPRLLVEGACACDSSSAGPPPLPQGERTKVR
jgi:hypothetical protein